MITKIAKPSMIRFLVYVSVVSFISLAKASEACSSTSTLSQGTNGTREVLSIPDPQSSIPSDLLTTPSSLTRDWSDHDVVDEDDDRCHHQGTEAWICRNHYVTTDQSPPRVDVHSVGNPTLTGEITTEIQTLEEEEAEDDDDDNSFTFGNTLVGLTFEAAVFLMVSSVQPPRGNSTSLLATWSPPWSRSPPPPPPSSLSISLSASFPLTVALLAFVIGLTGGLIGWMMLRREHIAGAKVCRYACILSVAVAFYSMTYGLVADNFAWAIWAAAGILFLVFAYCIA